MGRRLRSCHLRRPILVEDSLHVDTELRGTSGAANRDGYGSGRRVFEREAVDASGEGIVGGQAPIGRDVPIPGGIRAIKARPFGIVTEANSPNISGLGPLTVGTR